MCGRDWFQHYGEIFTVHRATRCGGWARRADHRLPPTPKYLRKLKYSSRPENTRGKTHRFIDVDNTVALISVYFQKLNEIHCQASDRPEVLLLVLSVVLPQGDDHGLTSKVLVMDTSQRGVRDSIYVPIRRVRYSIYLPIRQVRYSIHLSMTGDRSGFPSIYP